MFEVGVLDKLCEMLVDGLSGNFLMCVVKDEFLKLCLKLIISCLILKKVSEMSMLEGLIVVSLKRVPGLIGVLHEGLQRYL